MADKYPFTKEDVRSPHLSAKEKQDIADEWNKNHLEAEAVRYSECRQAEYPSIQECVHAILDDDLAALQEKRQAVKKKYPKPEEQE
mgnify:CR=1 FL=1